MEVLSSRLLVRPRDHAASVAFYRDVLGLAVHREFPGGVVFFLGHGLLEVSGRSEQAPTPATELWLQVRDLPATAAELSIPFGVAPTADGGFLIDDPGNQVVRKVAPGGIIATVAGTGVAGFGGDGGPATLAQLNNAHNVVASPGGGFLGTRVPLLFRSTQSQMAVLAPAEPGSCYEQRP